MNQFDYDAIDDDEGVAEEDQSQFMDNDNEDDEIVPLILNDINLDIIEMNSLVDH